MEYMCELQILNFGESFLGWNCPIKGSPLTEMTHINSTYSKTLISLSKGHTTNKVYER